MNTDRWQIDWRTDRRMQTETNFRPSNKDSVSGSAEIKRELSSLTRKVAELRAAKDASLGEKEAEIARLKAEADEGGERLSQAEAKIERLKAEADEATEEAENRKRALEDELQVILRKFYLWFLRLSPDLFYFVCRLSYEELMSLISLGLDEWDQDSQGWKADFRRIDVKGARATRRNSATPPNGGKVSLLIVYFCVILNFCDIL